MEPLRFDDPRAGRAPDGAKNLPGFLAALRARKRGIAIPTLLSLAAALAFMMLAPPRDTGAANILLATLVGFSLVAGVAIAKALLSDARNRAIRRFAEAPAEPEVTTATSRWTSPAAETERAEAEDSSSSVDAIVDALIASAEPGEGMTLLVTGEAAPGALAVALTAARRLSKRGRAALIDVGATQPWLTDVLDRGPGNAGAMPGLTDVLDGRAGFDQALYRDLSTSLDILPAGRGEIDETMLGPVLASLAQTYAYVVVHASNWRAPPGCAAIGAVDAAIVCAPAGRVEAARQRLRDALADPTVLTEGIAVSGARRRLDRAA